MIGGAGSDQINLGAGFDTVTYQMGTRAQHTVAVTGRTTDGVSATVRKPDGSLDAVTGVDRIKFTDGVLAFDTTGNAGQVYRLYQAAFARTPDTAGLAFWVKQTDNGMTLDTVSGGFVGSPEFQSIYGVNASATVIVDRFYRNVLGRAGEPGGSAFWTNEIATGARTAKSVLLGFSESPENQTNLAGVLANGAWLPV